MADVTPEVSVTRSDGGNPGGEEDPFLRLHKMSTTAGLGSGDYVAISGAAIAAMLLGIASALVLFNSYLLLLIPLAGAVCAILAFRQIGASNGTQTGRALAVIGLLLSVGFGGVLLGKEAITTAGNKRDQQQIVSLIDQFGNLIRNDKYAEAYNLCGSNFKSHVPEAFFIERWKASNASSIVGRVLNMTWNEHLAFETDPVTDERTASGIVLISFEKLSVKDREPVLFRKVGDQWLIDQIPQLFPANQPPQPGGPRGASGMGAPPGGPAGPPAPQ